MAELPRLAVFFEERSASILETVEAARDLCRIVWVIGWSSAETSIRALSRFGEVADVTAMTDAQVIGHVASLSPDGVFVLDDSPLRLAAGVAEEVDLRFHRLRTARLLTDKLAQREVLAKAGVPGPGFWPIKADGDPLSRAKLSADLHYPVVLKPESGSGSRDTYEVPDAETLLKLLEESHRKAEDMLIEEKLVESRPRDAQRFGEVLMVDTCVSEGLTDHIVVAGHFIPAAPFRGTGSFIPSHLDPAEVKKVLDATEAAVKALGIENGFINTDLILTPDGPRVLEVNGRIGGQIPTLLGLAGSPSLVSEAMKFALGRSEGELEFEPPARSVAFCAMYQAPIEACRLTALTGMGSLTQLHGVTNIVPNRKVGDVIDWRQGTMSRLFTAYGVADDHDHLYELYQQIQRSVVARYDLAEVPT